MTEPSTPTGPVEPTAPGTDPTEPVAPADPTETPDTPAEPPATEPATASCEGEQEEAQDGEPFDAPEEQHISRVPTIEAQRKQQDRDFAKLERENARHDARVREIMGEDAQYLVNCPLCADGPNGFLIAEEGGMIGDEKLQTLRGLLGIGQPLQLKPHPTTHTCETCDGMGEVSTGSKLMHHDKIQCPTCKGKGWEGLGVALESIKPGNGYVAESTITGPTVYTDATPIDTFDDDPAVASLRERGFMVIPPMKMNAV